MAPFSAERALPVGVVGARQVADPNTGAEAIAVALQPDDGGDPRVFSLDICAAYSLREVIDAALEAPYWWDDDGLEPDDDGLEPDDESHGLMALVRHVLEGGPDAEVISLRPAIEGSVRWDETWAASRPR